MVPRNSIISPDSGSVGVEPRKLLNSLLGSVHEPPYTHLGVGPRHPDFTPRDSRGGVLADAC